MQRNNDKLVFSGWVVVEPAAGDAHLWVAHCLDLDVISQGDSPRAAIDAVTEAVEIAVLDDLNEGLNPTERTPAPKECWERLARILKRGKEVKVSEVNAPALLVTRIALVFERVVETFNEPMNVSFNLPPSTAHVEVCAAA